VKILRDQPMRLFLTIGGIALCIVLMLFLLSVYFGVRDGSVDYIRANKADLWVLQRNAWNILRGSSILSTSYTKTIKNIVGVESVSPILLLLTGIEKDGKDATVFLTGYDLNKKYGSPPLIIKGRSLENDSEIILDHCFADKMNYHVGDYVFIQDDTLHLVGLSDGTNALVIQYAFVTLNRAQSLIGFPGIATCFAVETQTSVNVQDVSKRIQKNFPRIEVYTHQMFLENNIQEMESGFLPALLVVAVLGTVVLTIILSLLLSINIIERRKDFAILKVIGSPSKFLPRLVIEQAMLISSAACIAALFIFYPVVFLIESVLPEVNTKSSVEQVLAVIVMVWLVSFISSLFSSHRIRKIYPLEVF
jgi:ABC-type antimicrobial peptide transport system permease subunit